MKRTNVYLDEDQIRILKHLAVDSGTTFTNLVRMAVSEFIAREAPAYATRSQGEWARDFEALLHRVRSRGRTESGEEAEADITEAREQVRRSRRRASDRS